MIKRYRRAFLKIKILPKSDLLKSKIVKLHIYFHNSLFGQSSGRMKDLIGAINGVYRVRTANVKIGRVGGHPLAMTLGPVSKPKIFIFSPIKREPLVAQKVAKQMTPFNKSLPGLLWYHSTLPW